MRRKHFSAKERARIFALYGGKCHICEGLIRTAEAWEIEHLVPWELTQDDSDENLRPAHTKCHKAKTRQDIAGIRKADRLKKDFEGTAPPSRTPLPFGKNSPFKRKFNGQIVKR